MKQIIRLSIVLCMNIYTYQIGFILQWPVENNSTIYYSDKQKVILFISFYNLFIQKNNLKDLWWQIKHGRLFINYLIHNTDYLDEFNLIEIKYKKIC